MKEIGGYFGLEKLVSNEYYQNLIPLNSGRNALLYLLKAKNIRKLYVPSYICDSIVKIITKNDYQLDYYSIDSNFMPIFDKYIGEDEYLYVVNYYGQLTNEKILLLKEQYNNIILDYTHAFFQKPILGIDTIYSCRKFFGVADGAYLSTNTKWNEELPIDISRQRMEHLLGRYEGSASDYYDQFKTVDKSFDFEPIKFMSKITHNLLGAIDYTTVCRTRNQNYAFLSRHLDCKNKLQIIVPKGAFAYPFYIENGYAIRKALAEKKIYVPTLWPNVINVSPSHSLEYKYAVNILPLPCDQRYDISNMIYLVKELKRCIG